MAKIKNDDIASRLKKRITLQTPIAISDGAGGMQQEWQDYKTVYAEVNAIFDRRTSGTEVFASMQLMSVNYYMFAVRYASGVTKKMRIIYNKRIFNIKRVVNFGERNVILQIIAEENIT